MQSIVLFQPSSTASSRFYKLCARILQPTFKRHESSYRRSRSKLNIKPDASFLPSKTEPHDHIIFNPPPSMPNVFHTPAIFLPKTDRRRQIQAAIAPPDSQLRRSSSVAITSKEDLPPPILGRTGDYQKRYHLTGEQIDEMRALRKEDPVKWTANQLAKKFDCSSLFVTFVIKGLAPEQLAEQKAITDVVKSRWGKKRRIAREDREIRKEKWFRDE